MGQETVNSFLKKRDELIAANPADRATILGQLVLANMKQLDFEG